MKQRVLGRTGEKFKPLSDGERREFFKEILLMTSPENVPWKAEDWDNPKPGRNG